MQSLKFLLFVCLIISAVYEMEVNAKSLKIRNKELFERYRLNEQLLRREGRCEPKIRFSYISDHPDAESGIEYFPPAAVLHVCEPSGGCCYESARHRCQPDGEEEVEVVFITKRLGHRHTGFQTFTFTNHTQCACMDSGECPR